ncbi:serine hydrolase domain-containing protein [Marinococcus sp. PL1-022]|uniref:serine hydrolase domain-containing protein n=1 Tax=Marinococcus sp. PL1-022 TaxID=3095363 RepID=UPI0029C4A9D9|nr:serine hydrolase domain-containing protein [Marinococcus sp. PL1-022]MDX6153105.1 serine hydrolase domain-containing protein [Marinococcus sp. PL1-022]
MLTYRRKKNQLHRQLKAFRHFSGYVSVQHKHRILFQRGYGFADETEQTLHTSSTTYRIGSLTKSFTAAAILLLQTQGRLHVHDPVAHYLPDYPNGDRITLHQLLSMSSGIPNYLNDLLFSRYNIKSGAYQPSTSKDQLFSPQDLIACFQDKPLVFFPGSAYAYSNSNYVLLGHVVEVVSGHSYSDFLQKHIFAPLGMTQSQYCPGPSNPTSSKGYDAIVPVPTPVFSFHNSLLFAAGGITSSVRDLRLWLQALHNNSLLPASLTQRLFTPATNMYGSSYAYAYGWIVDQTAAAPIVEHTGTGPGYSSYMYVDAASRTSVIICSNSWGESTMFSEMYQRILNILST